MSHHTHTVSTRVVPESHSNIDASSSSTSVAASLAPHISNSTSASMSSNIPIPTGAGALLLVAQQGKVNSARLARQHERAVKEKQKAVLPRLLSSVLPATTAIEEAQKLQAPTPAFGTETSSDSARNRLKEQRQNRHQQSGTLHTTTDVEFDTDANLVNVAATNDATHDEEENIEVQRINAARMSNDAVEEEKQEQNLDTIGKQISIDVEAAEGAPNAADVSAKLLAMTAPAHSSNLSISSSTGDLSTPGSSDAASVGLTSPNRKVGMIAAGVTTNIAQVFRAKARQKSLMVKAHALGIHGYGTGKAKLGSENRAKNSIASAFLQASDVMRRSRRGSMTSDPSVNSTRSPSSMNQSLASVLQSGQTARFGNYQLSEEEKKISAYYSTIQNATSKVQEYIDSLMPKEDDDPELLTNKWRKQGLGDEEIAIRMAARGPQQNNEHEAYRSSFKKLSTLLDGLSSAALTSRNERGGYSSMKSFAEEAEDDEDAAKAEKEIKEAEEALARALNDAKDREENEALDRAEAVEALLKGQSGAGGAAGSAAARVQTVPEDLESEEEESSDEEAQLEEILKKERNAKVLSMSVASALASSLASAGNSTAASSATSQGAATASSSAPGSGDKKIDPFSPTALGKPISVTPAAIYRDLHNFFLGKRRNELVDSKRLHLLETQQAQVESGSETSRIAIHESMRLKETHTAAILNGYHDELKSISSRFGNKFMQQLDASIWRNAYGEDEEEEKKNGPRRSAAPSSEEVAARHMKLELLVAMLQARVAEQDELLACINVEETPQGVIFTYNHTSGRSFDMKAARLLRILQDLQATLLQRQQDRFNAQDHYEKVLERIAQLQGYSDRAEMERQEKEDAERKEIELKSKHEVLVEQLKGHIEEQESRFQEFAKKNQSISLTMKSVETELSGLHQQREHDTAKMNMLRTKHKNECVQIMRGNIPRHLLSLMHNTLGAGAANHGALSMRPSDEDLDAFSDPEHARSQLTKDAEVQDLNLDDIPLDDGMMAEEEVELTAEAQAALEAAAAAEALAAQAAQEAEEAALDARASTPVSKSLRHMEKVWKSVQSHEMAYIPWQEEIYNTIQPTFNDVVNDISQLKAKIEAKQAVKTAWLDKQLKAKAEAEADAEVAAKNAALAEEESHEGDEAADAEGDADSEGETTKQLGAAATVGGKFKPKKYVRAPKTKSFLNRRAKNTTEEDSELTEARLRSLGHNSFVSQRISAFNIHKSQSNLAYKNHIDDLRADQQALNGRMQALMAEWDVLHKLEQTSKTIETQQIVPTKHRIETVKGFLQRVRKAIADKVSWEKEKAAATAAREAAELKALEEEATRRVARGFQSEDEEKEAEEAEAERKRMEDDAKDALRAAVMGTNGRSKATTPSPRPRSNRSRRPSARSRSRRPSGSFLKSGTPTSDFAVPGANTGRSSNPSPSPSPLARSTTPHSANKLPRPVRPSSVSARSPLSNSKSGSATPGGSIARIRRDSVSGSSTASPARGALTSPTMKPPPIRLNTASSSDGHGQQHQADGIPTVPFGAPMSQDEKALAAENAEIEREMAQMAEELERLERVQEGADEESPSAGRSPSAFTYSPTGSTTLSDPVPMQWTPEVPEAGGAAAAAMMAASGSRAQHQRVGSEAQLIDAADAEVARAAAEAAWKAKYEGVAPELIPLPDSPIDTTNRRTISLSDPLPMDEAATFAGVDPVPSMPPSHHLPAAHSRRTSSMTALQTPGVRNALTSTPKNITPTAYSSYSAEALDQENLEIAKHYQQLMSEMAKWRAEAIARATAEGRPLPEVEEHNAIVIPIDMQDAPRWAPVPLKTADLSAKSAAATGAAASPVESQTPAQLSSRPESSAVASEVPSTAASVATDAQSLDEASSRNITRDEVTAAELFFEKKKAQAAAATATSSPATAAAHGDVDHLAASSSSIFPSLPPAHVRTSSLSAEDIALFPAMSARTAPKVKNEKLLSQKKKQQEAGKKGVAPGTPGFSMGSSSSQASLASTGSAGQLSKVSSTATLTKQELIADNLNALPPFVARRFSASSSSRSSFPGGWKEDETSAMPSGSVAPPVTVSSPVLVTSGSKVMAISEKDTRKRTVTMPKQTSVELDLPAEEIAAEPLPPPQNFASITAFSVAPSANAPAPIPPIAARALSGAPSVAPPKADFPALLPFDHSMLTADSLAALHSEKLLSVEEVEDEGKSRASELISEQAEVVITQQQPIAPAPPTKVNLFQMMQPAGTLLSAMTTTLQPSSIVASSDASSSEQAKPVFPRSSAKPLLDPASTLGWSGDIMLAHPMAVESKPVMGGGIHVAPMHSSASSMGSRRPSIAAGGKHAVPAKTGVQSMEVISSPMSLQTRLEHAAKVAQQMLRDAEEKAAAEAAAAASNEGVSAPAGAAKVTDKPMQAVDESAKSSERVENAEGVQSVQGTGETFVLSSDKTPSTIIQPDSSTKSIRRHQSSSSLLASPKENLPMRTTNLLQSIVHAEQQSEEVQSVPAIEANIISPRHRHTVSNLDFAASPMGLPSFAGPMPTSFAPKKTAAKEQQEEEQTPRSSTAATTNRDQSPRAVASRTYTTTVDPAGMPLASFDFGSEQQLSSSRSSKQLSGSPSSSLLQRSESTSGVSRAERTQPSSSSIPRARSGFVNANENFTVGMGGFHSFAASGRLQADDGLFVREEVQQPAKYDHHTPYAQYARPGGPTMSVHNMNALATGSVLVNAASASDAAHGRFPTTNAVSFISARDKADAVAHAQLVSTFRHVLLGAGSSSASNLQQPESKQNEGASGGGERGRRRAGSPTRQEQQAPKRSISPSHHHRPQPFPAPHHHRSPSPDRMQQRLVQERNESMRSHEAPMPSSNKPAQVPSHMAGLLVTGPVASNKPTKPHSDAPDLTSPRTNRMKKKTNQ